MNAEGHCRLPKVPVQVRALLLLLLSLFVLKLTVAAIAWKHRGYSCAKQSGTPIPRTSSGSNCRRVPTIGAGSAVEVLYVGDPNNEDEAGWLYVRDQLSKHKHCSCEHTGWLPS